MAELLQRPRDQLAVLTILGGLVGLVAACGVWLVHGGLKLLVGRDLGSEESLQSFLSLQDAAGRFLGVLGAIIGLLRPLDRSAAPRPTLLLAQDPLRL